MTPNYLVFDIETIPDVDVLRIWQPDMPVEWTDEQVVDHAQQLQYAKNQSTFLPVYTHKVACISYVYRSNEVLKIGSIGQVADPEIELVRKFFEIIERKTPQIISWNGKGFDAPVLQYRSLLHGIVAPKYWDQGENNRENKWNNYLGKYHSQHLDLMDLIGSYQAKAPLDIISKMLGAPGKSGFDGKNVWDAWRQGKLADIRHYCETDVVNTYLVFARFQYIRGNWPLEHYQNEITLLRSTLENKGEQWGEFLAQWPPSIQHE